MYTTMNTNSVNLSALILRLALGIMFLAHGLTKLIVFTPAGTAAYFESLGFPSFMAYLTILFEIGGGIFLIIGILSKWIALLTFIQMIVICYIHFPNGWSFSNNGGGWEYPAFMALTALALFFIDNGGYTILKLKAKSIQTNK